MKRDETLRYVRHDTTRRPTSRGRNDPRMGGLVVTLDKAPDAEQVQAVVLGVAADRGVALRGGRLGAVDGPQRFRDYFWRLHAPEGWEPGAVLDAGDLMSAERTDETHARLSEVVDVLRERFPRARLLVVGGGQDALYGEVLGLARWLRRGSENARVGLLNIDAEPDAFSHEGEPHSGTAIRRLLLEKAAMLAGEDTVLWGLQRCYVSAKHAAFLHNEGVAMRYWPELAAGGSATTSVVDELSALGRRCTAVALSVDLAALSQAEAPGVNEPRAVGVPSIAVLRAAEAIAKLPSPSQMSLYGLNPRFDRDGATSRLAARVAWSYLAGQV